MSFNPNALATSPIQRVRLMVGDVRVDDAILEDSVYMYLLQKNGNSEIDTAIEALETIITVLTVNPQDEKIGDVQFRITTLQDMENRLIYIKGQKESAKNVPIVIRTDRKNWDDFNFFHK